MSLNPDIRDRAYQFFIEEAQELLQVLEDGLLNLKDDRSTSKIHELMRAAHSIKGGAASVELDTIKSIAHRLEDFFKALYSEKVEFDAQLESLLLEAYDGLREPLTEQMETGSFDKANALSKVEPIFKELEIILGDALKEADSYIPSATDLGVDIVASIFEIDVQQSLDNLSAVVENPQQFDVATELKEQLEVLGGFAELFTLPGFSEIIDLSNTAIANFPQQALEIARITIADCRTAREAILNGDRDRGGEPSAKLLAISQGQGESLPTGSSQILNALNSAADLSQESIDPADGLENLFGGAFTGENIFDPRNNVDSQSESEFPKIDDLFGEAFSASDTPDAMSVEAKSENIFDFTPEEEAHTEVIMDWEIPGVEFVLDEPASQEEDLIDFGDIDAVFGSNTPEDNAFEIINRGSRILNGETSDNLPESSANSDNLENTDHNRELLNPILEPEKKRSLARVIAPLEDSTKNQQKLEPDTKQSEPTGDTPSELNFVAPENIDTALKSISEIFEQLPRVKTTDAIETELSTPELSKPKKEPKNKARQQAPSGNQLSVRVDLERLERMNNIVGELVINRNSLALQNEQLQLGVNDITNKFNRFRTVTNKLRELSDLMLVESEHSQPTISATEIARQGDSFDSLEMDSYNQLHLLLQSILEEMMQLEEGVDDILLFARQSDRTIHTQSQMLSQMRDELMWARMLPLEQILKRFPRTLRDLSYQYKKPVNLNLIGTSVLVDKAVLEKLYDPLLHLLRNGFDHGIEPPEIRRQQGKPETGEIKIHAYYQGNQTIIEIRDDGKGLDIQKIIKKAIQKDLISAAEAANANQEQIFNLIFEPGFSTAETVSEISGRGVGMSVVREQIESLKGTISVNSIPNQGSVFTLSLPLTLTIAKLLVVSLGETAFALPSDSIEEIIIPLPEQIKLSGDRRFLYWNEQLISIYNLQETLQYNCTIIPINTNSKVFESVSAPQDWALPLLLLRRGKQLFALEVTRLITEQELVIKPFGKTLTPPKYIYGCTILGDGTLIPAIDGVTLINEFIGETTTHQTLTQTSELNSNIATNLEADSAQILSQIVRQEDIKKSDKNTQSIKQYTLMIIDDSTALRRTMALSLERQGYHVVQAKDGRDAIEQLRKKNTIDLIVCDVEMPHMNGFEFLGVRRRDTQIKEIPVIMLTSRSGVKHRNLANQLGANGYFTKPYVEQEFIKELNKILVTQNQLTTNKNRNFKTSSVQKKVTVLIVDDSSALRRTMSLSLQKKGYRILEARDGEEGLEQMYQNTDLALVICDIEMPKMNGFEVLSSRRQDPQLQKIPVAMLTSRNQDKHKNLAVQLGANAYFIKPYVENTFIKEIENLIK